VTAPRLERTLTLLAPLGAVLSGAVKTDASGNLDPPRGEAVIVDLITETRDRATLCTTRVDTTLQVTCIAPAPSSALSLLDAVRFALPFPEYDPGVTGALGRVPSSRALYGAFQRFTIHLSPADTIGS
jgi:hypothetical protein